jgi:hypothetical protein
MRARPVLVSGQQVVLRLHSRRARQSLSLRRQASLLRQTPHALRVFGLEGCPLRGRTRSLRRTPAREARLPTDYGASPSGLELLRQRSRVIRPCATPPSRLRGAREGCLQSGRGRADSSGFVWCCAVGSFRGTGYSRVPSGSRLHGSASADASPASAGRQTSSEFGRQWSSFGGLVGVPNLEQPSGSTR